MLGLFFVVFFGKGLQYFRKVIGEITYSEMKTRMQLFDDYGRPVPFSFTVVTLNQLKGTGGDVIKVEHAVKFCYVKYLQDKKRLKRLTEAGKNERIYKAPNHAKHMTTNIMTVVQDEMSGLWFPSGSIQKIHYRLITEFNGKAVIY
jgi:hypothetical protein